MTGSALPPVPDARRAARLGKALTAAGFTEPALRAAFAVGAATEIAGAARQAALAWPAVGEPLLGLSRLLIAGESLDRDQAQAGLGSALLGQLESAGLLTSDPARQRVEAAFMLVPLDDLLLCADRTGFYRSGYADCVPAPGPAARAIARMLVLEDGRDCMDLGCGTGYLACLLARSARRVIATDINPRALALSRFNAALNGLDNIECRLGGLYAPVAGHRFDFIVSNPPYVLSPGTEFVYRDGGAEICRAILDAADRHLAERGLLLMSCNWPLYGDRDWRETLRAWLADNPCGAWALAGQSLDARAYAENWLRQQDAMDDPAAARTWLDWFRSQGISAVGSGYLCLRREAATPAFREFSKLPPTLDGAGSSLLQGMENRALLARQAGAEARLAQCAFQPAADLEKVERSRLADGGWHCDSVELRKARGLLFAARLDPLAADIVAALDGRRPLAEIGAGIAASRGLPIAAVTSGLPALARRLLLLGLITAPVESGNRAGPTALDPHAQGCAALP